MSRLALLLCVWMLCAAANALPLPEQLEGWQDWVLHDTPQHNCPFISGSEARACIWPGRLTLQVGAEGARFSLQADMFAESWLALPGDHFHWPVNLQAEGKPLALNQVKGQPGIWLPPGRHRLQGEIRWQQMPSSLKLPGNYGLIELSINGSNISNPARDQAGKILLQKNQPKPGANTQRDHVDVQVYRLLQDGNPFIIETLLALDVTGSERELILGKILPSDFTPLSFDSALPARIESDGNLRIQVRPGRYTLRLKAYANKALSRFDYRGDSELWPKQEIWFFQADRRFRTVQIEGASTMDSSQLELSENWLDYPAYLIGPDTNFQMREIYRGDPSPPSNQLNLTKQLWLASSGEELTVRDTLRGEMFRGWRLEADADYSLGSVQLNQQPQLITQLRPDSLPGVEIRSQQIVLDATSKVDRGSHLPVSGWQAEFNKVQTTLHLPPAWSVLSVSGANTVNGSWISQWNLWDIFLVLVVAVSIGRVLRPLTGLLAFTMLVMCYHREGTPAVVLLFITAALALLPYAKKRFAIALSGLLLIFFAAALGSFLPFVIEQVRTAVYPQLEHPSPQLRQTYSSGNPANATSQYEADFDTVMEMEDEFTPPLQKSKRANIANIEEVVVAAARAPAKYASDYDASQVLQAGPGIPNWSWNSVSMSWSGPIAAGETTRIVFVTPLVNRLGNVLSVVLATALLALLLQHALRLKPWQRFSPRSTEPLAAASATLCFTITLFIGSLGSSTTAEAEVLVDKALLDTLQQRLLQKPQCSPNCASIESLRVSAQSENLLIQIRAHTSAKLAFPLPANNRQWWPQSVSVNGEQSSALNTRDGNLYVQLEPGAHSITLQGSLSAKETLNLNFHLPLHNVSADLSGWQLSGLPSKTRNSQNISLTRAFKIRAEQTENRLIAEAIRPFVKVERHLELGRRWTIETRVQRIAPSSGAINLKVPLLDGEAPISGDTHIDSASQKVFMDVRIEPKQDYFSWQSVMQVSDKFSLIAPQTQHWTELWRVYTSPLWHSEHRGLATLQTDASRVSPTWLPWPGERVDFTLYSPLSVSGEKLAIDALSLRHLPANRLSDTHLELQVRSTQGGEYDFQLPEGADLKGVFINGNESPMSNSGVHLKIPLAPGKQKLRIHWQNRSTLGFKTQTLPLALGRDASNIRIHMKLPKDRWILAVGGPQIGPAVLYWSLLLVIFAIAVALGRSKLTPLKTYQWLLLSFGVASLSLGALFVIAAWFIAVNQRSQFINKIQARYFNLVQVGLFLFSGVALLCLLISIPNSLLSFPNMYIQGNGSVANNLHWFQDQISGSLPQAWVISVPVSVYRITMLLWSLWLAFALMRWIRWAWLQLGTGGYWREAKTDMTTNTQADTNNDTGPETSSEKK